MSYILDALRKADAERERGHVPGLHAQPGPSRADDDIGRDARAMPPWAWFVGAVSVLAVAGVAWQWLERDTPQPPAAPRPAETPPVAMAPAPAPAMQQAAAPPAPVVAPLPAPPRAPIERATPARIATVAPVGHAPSAAAPRAATAPASSANEGKVYAISELPDSVRRELPTLAIGGSIYSDNAASRFLIINGQIFHEGDKVTPSLTLEQIKLKAAVLQYKGYRYSTSF
ncbi:MAG TPA: general secretion pathway protein GspB [Albitalea sp.]|nr:general secretion pathway protein GspB [Albitalea sp.]